jgi:hypothetical protein
LAFPPAAKAAEGPEGLAGAIHRRAWMARPRSREPLAFPPAAKAAEGPEGLAGAIHSGSNA